jgi:hypothetical protein
MGNDKDFLSRQRPWQRVEPAHACPVDASQQAWIEGRMHWFVEQFGLEAARRPVALPTAQFYPNLYTGTPAQIDQLITSTCAVMGVERASFSVELFDGSAAETEQRLSSRTSRKRSVGHYRLRDGRPVISLDQGEAAEPAVLTAIVAHELGHARLLGEGRVKSSNPDHERLTDLVTVFLGMGLFTANAAHGFKRTTQGWSAEPLGAITEQMLAGSGHGPYWELGYLTEPEFGYALACYCGLRREPQPAWSAFLDPGVRVHLKRSLEYFAWVADNRGTR